MKCMFDPQATVKKAARFLAENYLAAGFLLLFLWIVLITAWFGDDSLISLRQAWNAIHGQGFTWNFDQRVQAFTHPTWILLLTPLIWITQELFYTTLLTSIALSLLSIFWIIKHHNDINSRKNTFALFFPLGCLAFSQAYADYMASGLENSLSYFLIGLSVYLAHQEEYGKPHPHRLMMLFTLLALLFLNRFDYALLILPLAVYLFFFRGDIRRSFKAVWPAVCIVLAWFAFAIIYFGAPFPNTFYAKLTAGYPIDQFYLRGFYYYQATLKFDPVTHLILIMGIGGGFLSRRPLYASLSFGILLYLLYVFSIGGDFMRGRFFSVLVYVSAFNMVGFLSCRKIGYSLIARTGTSFAVIFLAFAGPGIPPLTDLNPHRKDFFLHIADEKAYYHQDMGVFSPRRSWPKPRHPATKKPDHAYHSCSVGTRGLTRPQVYWINDCALVDGFIARLPAIQNPEWRIGHHYRAIPKGYEEYLTMDKELPNKSLQPLLDDITQAVSGDLFTEERWKAIVRLNVTKPYPAYSDPYVYDFSSVDRDPLPDGGHWGHPKAIIFWDSLTVQLKEPILASQMNVSVDNYSTYWVWVNGKQITTIAKTGPPEYGRMRNHLSRFDSPNLGAHHQNKRSKRDKTPAFSRAYPAAVKGSALDLGGSLGKGLPSDG